MIKKSFKKICNMPKAVMKLIKGDLNIDMFKKVE